MKNNIKTETVQEYLARGGKITKCKFTQRKSRLAKFEGPDKDVVIEDNKEDINYDILPAGLKIALGIES